MSGLAVVLAFATSFAAVHLHARRREGRGLPRRPAVIVSVLLAALSLAVLIGAFVAVKAVAIWLAATSLAGLASVMLSGIRESVQP